MKTEYKTGIMIAGVEHNGGEYYCKCGAKILLLYLADEEKPKKREWCFECTKHLL